MSHTRDDCFSHRKRVPIRTRYDAMYLPTT